MDYTDLADISRTIMAKIKTAVGTPDVLPELLRNERNGVGFYLFHIQENSHYKNYPPPGKDVPPVNYTPMALNLFYQLSANWVQNSIEDAIEEQKLMSLAMKALHDNAEIRTSVAGKEINIKITLQTLSPSESVQYWAAAESPVRLSAYYEVSVVFLEPEETTSYAGRVLSYGNFIFIQGHLQITGSQNTIEYLLPPVMKNMQVKIQPAQAPPTSIIPPPLSSIVSFLGIGFTGSNLKLLLISPLWPEPAEALGAWAVTWVSENQVDMAAQETAKLQTLLTVEDIIPGLYAAQVSKTEQRTLPDLTIKTFEHLSNQFPFSIIPRIDGIIKGLGGLVTVTGYRFQHANIKKDDIWVYLGETRMIPKINPALAIGEFEVIASNQINFIAPPAIIGSNIPVRIMVRGIESEPKWISLP